MILAFMNGRERRRRRIFSQAGPGREKFL